MKYWDNITAMAEVQRAKGLEHYGQTIEENNNMNDPYEIIEEAQQESIDNLMYLEHSKRFIKNSTEFINVMKEYAKEHDDKIADFIKLKLFECGICLIVKENN